LSIIEEKIRNKLEIKETSSLSIIFFLWLGFMFYSF